VSSDDIVLITQLLAAAWHRFDELFVLDAALDYTRPADQSVYRGLAEIQDFFRDQDHPSAHLRSPMLVARGPV